MGKIIGLVVVAVLLVGGFLYWNGRKGMEMKQEGVLQTLPLVAEKMETPSKEEGGMISSIKDAMGLGRQMQCTYTMSQDGQQIESSVFIEGSKVKSTTSMGKMTAYSLMDGENQYMWTSDAKVGMQMSKACIEKMKDRVKDMPKSEKTTAQPEPKDMQAAFEMAKNVKCEASTGADFSMPAGVTFTDQCALLEQSTKMMQEMKDKLPAGMNLPIPVQ